MSTARLEVSDLDFDLIKNNLKTYLKQQSQFQDYDFEGSGLSVLLDILAYNTHYNAYYLNMVANESFMDTALLRDSVVSHAKMLNYTPYSVTAPRAIVNITVESGSNTPATLTIPKGFSFSSNLIDDISYGFVTLQEYTATKSGTQFIFENVSIYEGQLITYNFNYTKNSNPKSIFVLPDNNVDISTIGVVVTDNPGSSATQVYNKVTDILDVSSISPVYFIQESRKGNYEIYFGDGVVGKKLLDGSVVSVSYLVTSGGTANQANAFKTNSAINGYSLITTSVMDVAAGGTNRESVDSIKYSAAAQYTTQNRLVTFKDYESYIKNQYPSIDSLSVWGGEDEVPKVFGKVYIALKPKTNYYISEAEKQRIISEIINPKAIVSVAAEIRDAEYLYLIVEPSVQYDPKKTTLSREAIITGIRNAILSYKTQYLDRFASTFVLSKLQDAIDAVDSNSIIGSELTIRAQRRFQPQIGTSASYNVKFDIPLHRGTITNKLTSTTFDVYDMTGVRRTALFEESPQAYTGISKLSINNPGTGYTSTPIVTINGDGTGATAEAVVVNGRIQSINITNRGIDYTRATVTISSGGGYGAEAIAVIDARVGTLRTIYYDSLAQRQIINSNAGTIYYDTGLIEINDIRFLSISSSDSLIRMTIESEKGIIQSLRNTIITIDENDPTSIVTSLTQNSKS
jgi:hypothetical protein